MNIEFIYEKLGLIISILGLIITLLLLSNAYMKKLFFTVPDITINNIKVKRPNKSYLYLKRFFDVTFASILIIELFPLFVVTFILIKVFIKGTAIKKIKVIDMLTKSNYDLYVFRTIEERNKLCLEENDYKQVKIGRFGKFLRIYSLDELPKLINIIRGDISFVGRYAYKNFDEYLNNLQPNYIELLKAYPIGMVNLWAMTAQSYQNRFDSSEVFKYDLIYSSRASLLFDIYIIIKSIFIFLGSKAAK